MKMLKYRSRVLWIAPNLNHYKKRLLSNLSMHGSVELAVLAGRIPTTGGHHTDEVPVPFELVEVDADKRQFCFRLPTYLAIFKCLYKGRFDVVLMPLEKKLLPIIVWIWALRFFMGFRMVSYNHQVLRSRKDRITSADLKWSKWLFKIYDKIIFYTQQAMVQAVEMNLLTADKASFANNTLDTGLIWQHYKFNANLILAPNILFIGRLVSSKRVDLVLEYYQAIKKQIPNITLTLIGDGPDANLVKTVASRDRDIKWCGALVDEINIAVEMKAAHIVFVPGESGLSIVHALAYGKPYVTLELPTLAHGPELSYLQDGENGLLLDGEFDTNVDNICSLLSNQNNYDQMCNNAYKTAQELSIDNWCEQMSNALLQCVSGKAE